MKMISFIRYALRLVFVSWLVSLLAVFVFIPFYWLMEDDDGIKMAREVAIVVWRFRGTVSW